MLRGGDYGSTRYARSPLCHFSHFNIIRYCERPFKTAEEMNPVRSRMPKASDRSIGDFASNGMNDMQYVYVLRSTKDGKWYTGCTEDVRKRFSDHNDGKVPSTKGRGPFELIYYEASLNSEDAFAREKYLKSGMGKRYLKNRLKRFLSLTG